MSKAKIKLNCDIFPRTNCRQGNISLLTKKKRKHKSVYYKGGGYRGNEENTINTYLYVFRKDNKF